MIWSRFRGVSGTTRLIRYLAHRLVPLEECLDDTSQKLSCLHQKMPFIFFAAKQKCLIRGFVLFFYGKRMGIDIRLRFGCCWKNNDLKTHCWIMVQDGPCYETDEFLNEFEMLIDYV